jgi:predicted enzyme related to lactoylglutathione lyase
MTGPVGYWHVADLAATRDAVVAAGGSVDQAVQDFGGRLVGTVKDASGNVIGLIQNG